MKSLDSAGNLKVAISQPAPAAPGASIADTFVTISHDADLSGERVLTPGTGITITDTGANSTVVVAAAHEILSAAHTDTLAASVVQGDVIYGNATPKWARLAANATATKKYLQSVSGGIPSWEQVAYADLSGAPTSSGDMLFRATNFQ